MTHQQLSSAYINLLILRVTQLSGEVLALLFYCFVKDPNETIKALETLSHCIKK